MSKQSILVVLPSLLLLALCSCSSSSSSTAAFRVDTTTPAVIQGNDNAVAWTLTGAGFDPAATVTVPLAGVTVTSVTVVSPTQITFSLSADNTAPVGTTQVIVTNPDTTTAAMTVPTVPAVVTLATHVQPVLTASCVGCHSGGSPSAGLDLSSGTTFGATVSVASTQVPALFLVSPNNPDTSYLVDKIEGTQTVGAQMPFGGAPLSPTNMQLLRKWIEAGAPNN